MPSPETWLALAVLVLSAAAARLRARGLGWWERPVAWIARRKWRAILVAAMLPLVLRVTLLPRFAPPPEPRVHDEFSFLLGASTLAGGRLANPSTPFRPHFESMHILTRPTYASAFPPGRLRRRPHWGHSAVMGAGLAVLAGSRPFEGAVFGLTSAVVLLAWMRGRNGPGLATALRHVLIPLGLASLLIAGSMGFYFARVTGSPWIAPYTLYRSFLAVSPHFVWQAPRPEPLYSNQEMRFYYTRMEMHAYSRARGAADPGRKVQSYWRFYLGPLLSIPLITLPLAWRNRGFRPLLGMAAGFSLALAGQVWHNPHYAAPATGLLMLLVVLGMRRLRLWRPWGLPLVRLLPVACVAMLGIQVLAGRQESGEVNDGWRWSLAGGAKRAAILKSLERSQDKHLVLVRYAPWHESGDEWVYNGADLENSPVLWVRELDRFSNQKLIAHFAGRRVWLVEPDPPSPTLIPYDQAPTRPMPFVALGAPGIESLRAVGKTRQEVRDAAGAGPLGCDQWNYYFTEVTGVRGPDVANGCFSGTGRGQSVTFDAYWEWLKRQR